MRQSPDKADELELELPALDGEDDGTHDVAAQDDLDDDGDFGEDSGDAFDDTTGEDGPLDELTVEGAEDGWLLDAETAGTLDVGPFDIAIEPEGKVLEDDEADGRGGLEDLFAAEEVFVVDSGEEGPLADDEELREEDLPALDADDDGDVPDEDLFEGSAIGSDSDVRWDDRAWSRATALDPATADEADDSGVLAVPGEDSAQTARDAAWKRLEESGRAMAATFVPGGSVVVALSTPDRSRALVVRIQPDGEARIIAEVDPRASKAEDDGEACVVTFLRWDAARGCLFVGGNFGVETYQPT
jgi:hypothetical protein